MDQPIVGKRILIFVGEVYEDLELWYPKLRLIEAGAEVVVAGEVQGQRYAGKNGYPCVADAAIDHQFGRLSNPVSCSLTMTGRAS